ncbi:MAG TPA: HigA family addiction module antitoxin [Rhabdochlamydiaceae bacterium]|jgi:addiction module HigA family antidote
MLPKNRKPTHPGKILLEEFLKPLVISSRQFADLLGGDWNEKKVDALIQEKISFSDKWAEEFAEILGTTPLMWRNLQAIYHEWEFQRKRNEKGALKPWKKAV